jgi:phage/plasmid-associated DNA primase
VNEENFGKSEWESMSSTLKRMITSNRISLQNKGTKAYEAENINNYILLSNNDAIKDDEGRRYFILDVSTHRLEDDKYFSQLYNECFNDKVGEAFYHYLYTIDLEGYNAQKYPLTQNKLDSFTKRLDNVYQFLKDEYILLKQPIKCTVNELYEQYKIHGTNKKIYLKQDFNKKMEEINIKYYKSQGHNIYKASYEQLLDIANKRHWIHKLDEFVEEDNKLVEEVKEIEVPKEPEPLKEPELTEDELEKLFEMFV